MKANTIYNENCLDTMARMGGGSIDLTVTSPPYDNLREYNGYSFPFEDIAQELFRVTKDGGVVVWVVADSVVNGSESGTSFKQALFFKEVGFNIHDTMIYYSEGLTLNHNRYEQEFEFMFVFSKGKPSCFNPIKVPCKWFGKDSDRTGQKLAVHNEKNKKARSGKDRGNIKQDKIKGNIWKYLTGSGHSSEDKTAFEHPAIFPEKLAADHIHSWSNENDLVYDPFCGSGTVPKMAHTYKRNWIGSEISKEYVDLANKRLEKYLTQIDIFDAGA